MNVNSKVKHFSDQLSQYPSRIESVFKATQFDRIVMKHCSDIDADRYQKEFSTEQWIKMLTMLQIKGYNAVSPFVEQLKQNNHWQYVCGLSGNVPVQSQFYRRIVDPKTHEILDRTFSTYQRLIPHKSARFNFTPNSWQLEILNQGFRPFKLDCTSIELSEKRYSYAKRGYVASKKEMLTSARLNTLLDGLYGVIANYQPAKGNQHESPLTDELFTEIKELGPWWLAELLMAGTIGKNKRIRSSIITSRDEQEFKKLTRLRTIYVNYVIKQKNRIHKVFDRNGCKITSLFGENKFSNTALIVYSAFAQDIDWEMKITQLKAEILDLKDTEKGNRTRALKFIQKHQDKLKEITAEIVIGELTRVDRISLILNLQLLEQFSNYVNLLEREIQLYIEENDKLKEDIERIITIPGIGQTTASVICSEFPNIDNFTTGEEFASFADLVPSVSQSAKVTHIGHITKRGSPNLRQAFYQAAKVSSMNKKQQLG